MTSLMGVQNILTSANAAVIAIGAGATVLTKAFKLSYGDYFGLCYKAASAGAIDLTITLEQSFQLPTTEGSADTYWVTPTGLSSIHDNLADANLHIVAVSPVAMPYGRFKIVSAAGVANTIQMWLAIQES